MIMPLVSLVFGGLDFANYYFPLAGQAASLPLAEAKKLGAVFAYGSFITVALNFIILAFVIFIMVRQINRLKTSQESEAAPEDATITPEDVLLLREIRDSLKNKT
jgi:large conductance mechanosensitive channel